MYSIITIDGLDGSGKATISKLLTQELSKNGQMVVNIEPPFYDTLTGMIVSDYLQNGYGYITDRWVVSQMYSFDRNMWMRNHFNLFLADDISNSKEYPCFTDDDIIFLYNRNWLSNLLYQTTIDTQEDSDNLQLDPYCGHIQDPQNSEFCTPFKLSTLHDMYQKASATLESRVKTPNYLEITSAYQLARASNVASMIHRLYDMEIAPWRACARTAYGARQPYSQPIDFVQAASSVINIVLMPKPAHLDIIYQNMMKRYEGDAEKMDRNEKSHKFMASVAENVQWLYNNMAYMHYDTTFYAKVRAIDKNRVGLSGAVHLYKNASDFQLLSDSEYRAFNFEPIYTTNDVGNQDSVADNLQKVIKHIRKRYVNPI